MCPTLDVFAPIIVSPIREEAKENEKEKEKMRTDYMLELFASTFNIDELENRMLKRRDKPHSHDMEHKVISYSQFMMKQEPNCEHELPKKEHNVIVALNEHIHNMHDANMIDMVPRKAIEDVKKNKKKLRDMVERYLMPHYQARRINKILYEEICKNIVHHHFKSNDYSKCWSIFIFHLKIEKNFYKALTKFNFDFPLQMKLI